MILYWIEVNTFNGIKMSLYNNNYLNNLPYGYCVEDVYRSQTNLCPFYNIIINLTSLYQYFLQI